MESIQGTCEAVELLLDSGADINHRSQVRYSYTYTSELLDKCTHCLLILYYNNSYPFRMVKLLCR